MKISLLGYKIQLMSEASNFSCSSPANEKNHCCQTMLLSVLQRIEELEGKLKGEVEHRENDFNDLLRLIVKDKVQAPGSQHFQPLFTFKESKSKLLKHNDKSPVANNRKQTIKNVLNKRLSSKRLASQKLISQSQEKKQIQSSPNDTLKALQCRTKSVEQNIVQHQAELGKMKELNDYLIDQLLVIFQKIKHLEAQQSPKKGLPSLETVTSMLIEGQAKKQHIELISDQLSLEIRQTDWSKVQFSDLKQKVAQHQSVLSELIQITRQVSAQIGRSPRQPTHPRLSQI